MAATKLEAGLVSAGLVALGVIGYFVLSRNNQSAPRSPAPGAQPQAASPAATPVRARAPGPARDRATKVSGTVRDLLTGAAVAEVDVAFQAPGQAASTATSDALGHYALELLPGRYQVRARGADVAMFDSARLAIEPGPGEPVLETYVMDIQVLRLAQVEGRVVDSAGLSLSGVTIGHRTLLLDRTLDQDDTAPHGAAVSEPDGGFSIRVPPGEVELVARTAGLPESTTTIRWVEPGAHLSGVEIVMDQGATVSGTVVDPAGVTVTGATVIGHGSDQDQASLTRTGAGGAFEFVDLVPGQVQLQAEAPGFARSAVVTLHVDAERPARGVVLTLAQARAVSGRVVAASGDPVAGATVTATPMTGRGAPADARTDDSGTFALSDLGSEPFLLRAAAPGFAPALRPGVSAPAREVEMVLTRSGALAGQVTARGTPLQGFSVRLLRRAGLDDHSDDSAGQGSGPAPAMEVDMGIETFRIASAGGSYRIDDLRPGVYNATFSAPGFAPQTVLDVRVPPGGEGRASADLGEGAILAGTVTRAGSGAPIGGALVRLSTGSESPATYTDARGAFSIADIAPGRRSLEVRHPAYVGAIRSAIELAAGRREHVAIAMQPLAFGADSAIEFAGIGAVISMQGDRLVVQAVLPHGPAEIAGLAGGDEITHINGQPTSGRGLGANIEDIRGVAGTVVRVRVRRGDTEFDRDVVRGTVRFNPDQPPAASEQETPDNEPPE